MNLHFQCTQCGHCCRSTRIPLSAREALSWLNDGNPVQLICEAYPWPVTDREEDPRAAYAKRKSFEVMSGSLRTRIVVIFVAHLPGACPNLLPDMRCGIYERRPRVCRIYPCEVNPFVALEPGNKGCPAEAWTVDRPLLQRDGHVVQEDTHRAIEESRDADANDVGIKQRVCAALDVSGASLAQRGFLVFSFPIPVLRKALSSAIENSQNIPVAARWRFVSDEPKIVAALTAAGAIAVQARGIEAPFCEYLARTQPAVEASAAPIG